MVTATRTEREIELEEDLRIERESHAGTKGEKTARENRINELEDELRRLKSVPVRKTETRSCLERFMAGEDV